MRLARKLMLLVIMTLSMPATSAFAENTVEVSNEPLGTHCGVEVVCESDVHSEETAVFVRIY